MQGIGSSRNNVQGISMKTKHFGIVGLGNDLTIGIGFWEGAWGLVAYLGMFLFLVCFGGFLRPNWKYYSISDIKCIGLYCQ